MFVTKGYSKNGKRFTPENDVEGEFRKVIFGVFFEKQKKMK